MPAFICTDLSPSALEDGFYTDVSLHERKLQNIEWGVSAVQVGGGSSRFLHLNPSASISLNQCLNLTGGFLRRVLRVRREQRSDDCPFVSLPSLC